MSWQFTSGRGPVVAAAIHAGHRVRPGIVGLLTVDPQTRLREEDPFTDEWTAIVENRIVVRTSRFEFDLNRPRDKAIYATPGEAWGIHVWKIAPSMATVQESLARYDRFYAETERFIGDLLARYRRVVVLDLHAYCHRRGGPDAPDDDPDANPEINVGTGSVDRDSWSALLDRFIDDLAAFDFGGRRLDVRENVKFRGGHFPTWINQRFAGRALAIALEVKKIFMDEWTGDLDRERHALLGAALESTVPGILAELGER